MLFANYLTNYVISDSMREEAVVGSNIFQVQTQQTGFMRCAIGRLITQMDYRDMVCVNSSDGRVVRASASLAIDSGLIPSRVKPMTLKLVFTASLLDAQH